MENLPEVISAWFHLMAIVTWLGLVIYSALMFFPSIARAALPARAVELADFRRKAIGILLAAIIVFAITGFALIMMNEHDEGMGNVFANDWTTMIFTKHILIILMIILEFWVLFVSVPRLIKAGGEPVRDTGFRRNIGQIQVSNVISIILGMAVLFLVAALP